MTTASRSDPTKTFTRGWLNTFAGDGFVADRLSEPAQIADMLRVEAAYAKAAGKVGKVPADMGDAAAGAIMGVTINRAALAERAFVDGLPVPGLVAQIKAQLATEMHPAVHVGMTSQDVMDTALLLALREILESFESRIGDLQMGLRRLDEAFGASPLVARTRMQAALPITAGHRIAQWGAPLEPARERLAQIRPRLLRIQLGGPVGTRESFDGFGDAIADHMARALGLLPASASWHSERSSFAELAGWCGLVCGALGKIGADVCLMAQQGVDEIRLTGGGASSAMAHKSNPVQAELLVALAREATGLQATMQQSLMHEQERSGAAWTLEWLILPRLLEATGAALNAGVHVVTHVEAMGAP